MSEKKKIAKTEAEDVQKLEASAVPTPDIDIEPLPDVLRFRIGEMVYHKLDPLGSPGLVMGHLAQPGHYKYLVRWESLEEDMHYDFELSKTPNTRDTSSLDLDDDDEI